MKTLAIIPARGGSKRIPRKNIQPFMGKPIIEYSIQAAIASELFDEVMVSTDDEEIIEIAKKAGAKVPFVRSSKTANDHAHLGEVIAEVLEMYAQQGKNFDTICCILATAPFITAERIKQAYTVLDKGNYDSVIPVLRFSFPIQRAFKVENETLSMFQPEHLLTRSQDLEPAFHDSGQFYWMRVEAFQKSKVILTKNTGYIELSEMEVQDIDTVEDWAIAEFKYSLGKDKKE